MTRPLFRDDAYLAQADAVVSGITDTGGIVLDAAIFYARGGGQPGDSGWLAWDGHEIAISDALKGDGDDIVLLPEPGAGLPAVGQTVHQRLDWDRRFGHMRVHSALHLLSVVIPLPVTGGAIGAAKGRLDFNMPDALEDKEAVQAQLNELIGRDLPVSAEWITDAELAANPGLVKTMSVMPPTGAGQVRLIRIGQGEAQVDLQPCGGTHVARTGEIGPVRLGKVEKKGALNRRVSILIE